MFHVSSEETIRLAGREGLAVVVVRTHQRDFFGRPDVTWTSLGRTKAN